MDLITNITEVQNFVAVAATSDINSLRPYFRLSNRNYLVPVLGTTFFQSLVTTYDDAGKNADAIVDEKQKQAVKLAQEAIANLGTMHALPILSVMIGSNGIQVVKSDSVAPASQWRTEQVFESLAEVGHQAIDSLLTYLELEKSTFAQWAADSVYQAYQKYFIRSATDFTALYNIDNSRYLFHCIQYCMQRIEEFEIKKAVGSTLFAALKTADKEGSINGKMKSLLNDYLKPAIALFTIAKALQERLIIIKAGRISVDFKGTNTENMYESKSPQIDELHSTIASLTDDARNWITEAQTYINDNSDTFLEYATVTTSRRRMKGKNDNSGLSIF